MKTEEEIRNRIEELREVGYAAEYELRGLFGFEKEHFDQTKQKFDTAISTLEWVLGENAEPYN